MLLLLLLLPLVAQAITIETPYLQTFLVNGTQFLQQEITFACSNTDFQDPSLLVGNLSYNVQCLPPVYGFQTVLREFVEYQVRRYTAEYCEVNQIKQYAPATGSSVADTGDGVTRRRLLSEMQTRIGVGRRLLDSIASCINGHVQQGGQSSQAAAQTCINNYEAQYGCSSSNSASSSCTSLGTTSSIAFLFQQISTLSSIQSWVSGQQSFDNGVQSSFGILNQTLQAQLQELVGLKNESSILEQTLLALQSNTDSTFANISNSLTYAYGQLGQGLAVDVALSAREQQFENITLLNFQAVINATQQLLANISQNQLQLIAQNRLNEVLQRQQDAVFAKALAKVGPRRGLTATIFNLINNAVGLGFVPFLHPEFPGVRPGPASAASQAVVLDQLLFNFVNGSSAPFTAHQYTLTFYCSAQEVTNTFYQAATWMDITDQLGPTNCSTEGGVIGANCNCWIQVNHIQCPALSTFDWQTVSSQTSVAPYTLQSSYCQGGAQPTKGFYDGSIFDNLAAWSPLLSQFCTANLNLAPIPGGSGLHSPRIAQLVSLRMGSIQLQPASNPSLTCLPNYDYVFGGSAPENNIVFVFYTFVIQAQNLLLNDDLLYERQVYGVIPNYLTYELVPFEVLNDNKTYTCHRASFLARGTTTRPVFQVLLFCAHRLLILVLFVGHSDNCDNSSQCPGL